jgi:hypothetical protein
VIREIGGSGLCAKEFLRNFKKSIDMLVPFQVKDALLRGVNRAKVKNQKKEK